jgi:hypothetical protein
MTEYVHLIGAEEVSRAASTISASADDMRSAARSFAETTDRLIRALDEHAMRVEIAIEKGRDVPIVMEFLTAEKVPTDRDTGLGDEPFMSAGFKAIREYFRSRRQP